MNYKVIIDIIDNNEISNKISNELYQKLINNNINTLLLENNISTEDKIKEINKYNNAIVISNQMNNSNTSEIIYSLYFNDTFPSLLNKNLSNILNIAKYYQLRLPGNTSKDYYEIIRETPNVESIIIRYENINNNIINNIVNAIYDSIASYILKENIYTVLKGDTLYSIARKFNITPSDIINANNLATYNLSIGQEILIPKTSVIIPSEDYQNYTVLKGDSLYSIASKFNTTVNSLKDLNNLTNNNLSIGQILKIPNEDYQNYTVLKGDSLYSIASKFNTTVNSLKDLNNLTSNNLSIGQILKIPKTSTTLPNEDYQTYTVLKGDSLYSIASRFNTTVNNLKDLNNLTSNNLSIGQILNIPTSNNTTNKTYIVKSGDSLYKIANNFNTTVDAIKELNKLSSINLSIGQTLLIP